jgi:hypothetical protein
MVVRAVKLERGFHCDEWCSLCMKLWLLKWYLEVGTKR